MQAAISGFVTRFFKGPVAKNGNQACRAGFAKAGDAMLAQHKASLSAAEALRAVAPDTGMYGPERLPVTRQNVAQMRAEVAQAAARGQVPTPTEDQWAMIVADHPASCVVAGAGSGKSTTLVLRVVFMVCHLGIRPADITVFSFTRESCKELRKKLHSVFALDVWKARMHPQEAQDIEGVCKHLVKTFHAALVRQAKPGVQWFDTLKEADKTGPTEPDDDVENPISTASTLSEPQMNLLLTAYRTLFAQDPVFRTHVMHMLKMECDSDLYEKSAEAEYTGKTLATAATRDLELVTRINAKWAQTGWVMPGMDPTPCAAFRAGGEVFYANGRIVATGMPVFLSLNGRLGGDTLFGADEMIGVGGKTFPCYRALAVRRKVVSKYLDKESLHLTATAGIDRLRYRLQYMTESDFAHLEAPRFDVLLKGEIKKVDVLAAFYAQASFIENLGMEVPEALARMGAFRPKSLEAHFAAALARFWPAFEHSLLQGAGRVQTYNRAFLQLGEAHLDEPLRDTAHSLRSFTHLLVDEFQDISPQIVSWLRANQRRLATLGKAPTLMAIGDDWQSIYGWRGSAPEYFIDFGKHFPTRAALNGHGECRMMENYRSVAPIIADAEKLLAPVRVKINKQAKAMRPLQASDHGVTVVRGVNPVKNSQRVVEEILQQLAFVNSLPTADNNKVVVLSRTKRSIEQIKKQLGPEPGVSFYTFHGSKGLQGEVAILCNDCAYDQTHEFRNAVYAACGVFKQTYDDAARDEALRLAYVAVTRGIRRVVWFLDEPKGAATLLT